MQSISKKMSEMEIEQNTPKTTEPTETLNDKEENESQTAKVGKMNKKSIKTIKKTIKKAYKAQWELNMAIEQLNEVMMQYYDDAEGNFYSMPRSHRKRNSSTNSSSSSSSSSESDEEEPVTNSKHNHHARSTEISGDNPSAQKEDHTKSSKSKCNPEREFENHRDFHFNFNYGRCPPTGFGPFMRHREMGFPPTRNFGPLFMGAPRTPFGVHYQPYIDRVGGRCGGFGRF